MKYIFILLSITIVLIGCSQEKTSGPIEKEQVVGTKSEIKNEETETTPEHEYFNEEFKNSISNGFLPGAEFGIGSTVSEIKASLGEPEVEDIWDGANILQYGSVVYGYPYLDDGNTIHVIQHAPETEYFLNDLKNLLGEPSVAEISDINGMFFVVYNLKENKQLWVYTTSDSDTSPISYLKLIKKY
ncbi:DUF4309 domain-containing protein [Cytobacillus sp. S13-E01]|uniref:DUF4309 domain-containing protein n=1 Tax=Cytobacillus sp. S13-E01 TaxID=3031326 RepID=UPI0023D7CD86|nr:DUF4309 domain-containing protein [Cytobacillus sp. S13-E01]MDF0726099.1 DUF4309 domain-containing protein [Cytobacillus sp. S13-E01]